MAFLYIDELQEDGSMFVRGAALPYTGITGELEEKARKKEWRQLRTPKTSKSFSISNYLVQSRLVSKEHSSLENLRLLWGLIPEFCKGMRTKQALNTSEIKSLSLR